VTAFSRSWLGAIGMVLLLSGGRVPGQAQAPALAVTIDAGAPTAPMSKYIYGQFIEHLGRCIYGGIWAEMLEDRKFFYPVAEGESPWTLLGSPRIVHGDSPSATGWKNLRSSIISAQMPP